MKIKIGSTTTHEIRVGDFRLSVIFQFNGDGVYMCQKIKHLFNMEYERMTAKNFLALGDVYKELGELMKESQNETG